MNINIKILPNGEGLPVPKKATSHSSCVDLYAACADAVEVKAGEVKLIPTGIALEIPIGFEAQVRPRSGLAIKHSIGVLNSPGTIDSDYRGELSVILFNFGKDDFVVSRGDRIAQMCIAKTEDFEFVKVDELSDTQRGSGGFGHTGVKA